MLFFIRHGQTDANLNRLNAGGEWDVPLNETGMAQARAFNETNREFIEQVDTVFVSPMIRAQQTAELILKGHSKPVEVVEGLREWHLGEWSGTKWDEVGDYFTDRLNPPGGETMAAFEKRTIDNLKYAAGQHAGRVLVVAHGGLWYVYAALAKHKKLLIDNCQSEEICRLKLNEVVL